MAMLVENSSESPIDILIAGYVRLYPVKPGIFDRCFPAVQAEHFSTRFEKGAGYGEPDS